MDDTAFRPVRWRQLSLAISMETDGRLQWRLSPVSGGSVTRRSIPMGPVRDAMRVVAEALDDLTNAEVVGERYSQRHRLAMRANLRAAGERLSREIFGEHLASVAGVLFQSEVRHVEVTLPDEGVWPIDFCVMPGAASESRAYLGSLCLTMQRPPIDAFPAPAGLVDRLGLARTDGRKIGYAEDGRLRSACVDHATPRRPGDEEVYALGALVPDLLVVDFLPALVRRRPNDGSITVSDWLSVRRDVLHFNSHMEGGAVGRTIRVRTDFRISKADFKAPALAGTPAPFSGTFVFLNACSSIDGSFGLSGSLACALLEEGADVVACTSGRVLDGSATAFAREFYARFAPAGTSAIHALMEARRSLVIRQGHPLALLYTLLGDEGFSLRVV